MRSGSIGIRAASQSRRIDDTRGRAGFTLIEALVALALLLAFAAALGPLMFQSHRLLLHGDGQVQAELLLRSLLQTPFDRLKPEPGTIRQGEAAGLHWQLEVEPADAILPPQLPPADGADAGKKGPEPTGAAAKTANKKTGPKWGLFRIVARVAWGAGRIEKSETLQLGALDTGPAP